MFKMRGPPTICYESEDVTHGVGTVYFPRKFRRNTPCVTSSLPWPMMAAMKTDAVTKSNIFEGNDLK